MKARFIFSKKYLIFAPLRNLRFKVLRPHFSPGGTGVSGAACPCSTCVDPLEYNFNHLVKLSGALGLVTALFVVSRTAQFSVVRKNFTGRDRRLREGNVFSFFICSRNGGATPGLWPQVISWRGYPSQVWSWQ